MCPNPLRPHRPHRPHRPQRFVHPTAPIAHRLLPLVRVVLVFMQYLEASNVCPNPLRPHRPHRPHRPQRFVHPHCPHCSPPSALGSGWVRLHEVFRGFQCVPKPPPPTPAPSPLSPSPPPPPPSALCPPHCPHCSPPSALGSGCVSLYEV